MSTSTTLFPVDVLSHSAYCPSRCFYIRPFVPFGVFPFDVLSHSAFFPFNVFSSRHFVPFGLLSHSTLVPFDVLSHSAFFPFDVLSHSAFCLSTFCRSSFCPLGVCYFDILSVNRWFYSMQHPLINLPLVRVELASTPWNILFSASLQ